MTEYVHLMGAEQVAEAGHRIRSAADDMTRALGYFSESMQEVRHTVGELNARLAALQEIMERAEEARHAQAD